MSFVIKLRDGMNGSQTRETLAREIWRACKILQHDDNCSSFEKCIEHLSWLLFLRFLDAQENEWKTQAEIAGRSYTRILDKPYCWNAWAVQDWNADELLVFVHSKLIPHLQKLSGDPLRDTIRSIFTKRDVVVCASGDNLKKVLQILNDIDFQSCDDVFTISQVYEEPLHRQGNQSRLAGEFYTPRPVVRFVVEVVNPKIGEIVYDPACGTCGFLVEAYLHMKKAARTVEDLKTLQEQTFVGQEKKPVPALLGLMNMILHGVTRPEIRQGNTLEENIWNTTEFFDVILANPPFGGKEDKHIRDNFPVPSTATELLFLQHIMKKIKDKPKARSGMVVPDGILFRRGAYAKVKKILLEQFNLHTIVSLPPGIFAPYSDVKTTLLFFERPGPTKEIWYYDFPLPEGLKKFTKENPIQDKHFEEVRRLWKAWDAYRKRQGPRDICLSERSWIVSAEEIRARGYDLAARNPNCKNVETMPSSMEFMTRLMECERQILAILEELDVLLRNGNMELER